LTIKEIAKIAGVSTATVSKVINGKDQNISENTRNRILKIVDEEGYIPNSIARSLKVNETKTLGLIVPDVVNQFFSELARGVEDAAEKEGYTLILCNTDNNKEKEENYIKVMQQKMVDGIILAPAEDRFKIPMSRKIPLVVLDRDISVDREIGRIGIDNEEATYKSCSHLIEKGCKNIAFISSKNDNKSTYDRFSGYKRALMDNNINYNEDLIYLEQFDVTTGYNGIYKIYENTEIEIDGVCCGNDLIAIGAIKAIKESGRIIPRDVKVIGLDDIDMAKYVNPSLTTVKQPIYLMGEETVSMLISMIRKEDINLLKILDTELIERSSS